MVESWDQFRLKITDEVNEELSGEYPLEVAAAGRKLAAQKITNHLGLSDLTTVLVDITWADRKRTSILITRVVLMWADGIAELA